jgi:poly-gamma-glutamate biosynthesis protein PgsC/CapC
MNDPDGITIAIGILLGMFYFRQTGESPGGIITPGLVAMRFSNPQALCLSLGAALLLGVALRLFFRRFSVYGRQRVAFAMLCALAVRLALPGEWGGEGFPWLGWVVPGLVAADVERQGIAATFSGLASVSVAASWGASLVLAIASGWR